MNKIAPIALFTFKRPSHTEQTLRALASNPEFLESPLYIFCDGARHEGEADAVRATREIAMNWPHPRKTVRLSERNRGLARSVALGVTELCAAYGRAIVVEDDLVVSRSFLNFLNRALDHYSENERVMQISGHMFPVDFRYEVDDGVFLPFTTSWGWATWQRAWVHFNTEMKGFKEISGDRSVRRRFNIDGSYPYFSMLKNQRAGNIDSWAINWHLSVFMKNGLTLYPRQTMVSNEGFDGSGTHCAADGSVGSATLWSKDAEDWKFPGVDIDQAAFSVVACYLKSKNSFFQRARRRIISRLK